MKRHRATQVKRIFILDTDLACNVHDTLTGAAFRQKVIGKLTGVGYDAGRCKNDKKQEKHPCEH